MLSELISLIEKAKIQVASQANSSLTILFWHIGNRILTIDLNYERAEYGKQIVVTLSRELVKRYGKNYEEKNLRRMIQFAKQFSDIDIVVTMSRQLSWSHFLVLIPIKNQLARDFYAKLSYDSSFGVRELRNQIERKVYERTENADIKIHKSKVK